MFVALGDLSEFLLDHRIRMKLAQLQQIQNHVLGDQNRKDLNVSTVLQERINHWSIKEHPVNLVPLQKYKHQRFVRLLKG